MNANMRYEILAEAFSLMEGYQAPGKDVASGAIGELSFKERSKLFDDWLKDNNKCINAFMKAFEPFTDE